MATSRNSQACIVNACRRIVDSNQRCTTHRVFYQRHGQDGGRTQCVHFDQAGHRCATKTTVFAGHESTALCSKHDITFCRYRGCPNKTPQRGEWCYGHLQQTQRGANLQPLNLATGRRKPKTMTSLQWFAQYIAITPEQPLCWTFTSEDKRPKFYLDGRLHNAYRWSYEHFTATTLQPSQELDHTCRTSRCVNPSHLYLTDRAEHAAIESQRNRELKEYSERTGENIIWSADPEARLRNKSAFYFALEHQLPFQVEHMGYTASSKEAPLITQEREALTAALAERTTWLESQGFTEDSYSINSHPIPTTSPSR